MVLNLRELRDEGTVRLLYIELNAR